MLKTHVTHFQRLTPPAAAAAEHPRILRLVVPRGEADVDAALDGSFPASDPPAWNSGVARPAPVSPGGSLPAAAGAAGVIDVSPPPGAGLTVGGAFVSFAGASALTLVVPLAAMLVMAPVGLGVRAAVDILQRLVSGAA